MSNRINPRGSGRFGGMGLQRGLLYGVIIITALLAFEAFNYSTTQHALNDLLGDLTFLGFRWATILAIAFCGIDFAGIARLFTPTQGTDEPHEVWYLFGAWLLAATMNALLTWWGVSIALINHQTQSSAVIDPGLVMKAVPIVVAVMVWLIRILIIGTFSLAGERIFTNGDTEVIDSMPAPSRRPMTAGYQQVPPAPVSTRLAEPRPRYEPSHRPARQVVNHPVSAAPVQRSYHTEDEDDTVPGEPVYIPENTYALQEPTYQPVQRSARSGSRGSNNRRVMD